MIDPRHIEAGAGVLTVYNTDALSALREMPDESVQMVCTSPPYWSLRDYGIPPIVWDGDPECDHLMRDESPRAGEAYGGKTKWQHVAADAQAAGVPVREQAPGAWEDLTVYRDSPIRDGGEGVGFDDAAATKAQRWKTSAICTRCGAWRGCLGLEPTPELYCQHIVQIFREVRRALRKDGTLWLNLGDSYAAGGKGGGGSFMAERGEAAWQKQSQLNGWRAAPPGLKAKDLVGIPWRVARALQEPYYTGRIRRTEDRVWLAAMIDGEGCMFLHKRKAGQSNGQGYVRKNDTYGAGLEVANCHESIVRRCLQITGMGSICFADKESKLKNRNQRLFRWNLRSNECRNVIREIYPYLVGKQHEARLLLGCPSSGPDAEKAHASLIKLHNGFEPCIDFPTPESMYEQGWYLRSDIIWSKCNPMPESVTDRPTRAHEYLFLLSKSKTYYYDAEAIAEGAQTWTGRAATFERSGPVSEHVLPGQSAAQHRPNRNGKNSLRGQGANRTGVNGPANREGRDMQEVGNSPTRNRRSVWTIPTAPFPEAHFATFPTDLVIPCVLAGSKAGDVVLDPFGGSGTVGKVAIELGRKAILIEPNPEYVKMIEKRTTTTMGLPL